MQLFSYLFFFQFSSSCPSLWGGGFMRWRCLPACLSVSRKHRRVTCFRQRAPLLVTVLHFCWKRGLIVSTHRRDTLVLLPSGLLTYVGRLKMRERKMRYGQKCKGGKCRSSLCCMESWTIVQRGSIKLLHGKYSQTSDRIKFVFLLQFIILYNIGGLCVAVAYWTGRWLDEACAMWR